MDKYFNLLKGIVLFQKKMIIPVALLSTVLFALGKFTFDEFKATNLGIMFLAVSLTYHFLVYEVISPQEYYLYYNIGLSRVHLWLSTAGLGFIVILISYFA